MKRNLYTIEGQHRVVITGSGVISSLGDDWQSVYKTLKGSRSAVRTMPEWDKYNGLKTRLAAPIEHFSLPATYRKRQTRSMGRVAQMGVYAAQKALENAGMMGADIVKSGDMGVAFGSATGNSDATVEFCHLLENHSTKRINGTTYLRMMSHTAAVNISVLFGTQGRVHTTSSACTAGSQAIGTAYESIRFGLQKAMIAGGAEELCPTQAAVFDTLFAASIANNAPETVPRPFDSKRDGLVLGEGACALILESLENANLRGAPILAELVGYATNSDGTHLVRPNQETMARVIAQCLHSANVQPDEVGYVSAHGTATEHGDIAESRATFDMLGAKPISSLKSFTGHTLGTCGAFEAWASLMMMRENWFAPTLNLDHVDSRCAPLDYIQNEGRALETDLVISNNFAFGGINTSLLLRRWRDA